MCLRSLQNLTLFETHITHLQRAKKVVSDNLGLVDFAIGLVNSVLNLPDKQVKFFLGNSKDRRTDVITPALQKSLGANF